MAQSVYLLPTLGIVYVVLIYLLAFIFLICEIFVGKEEGNRTFK